MEIKQCPICGKSFENQTRYPNGWGKERKTCSRQCGAKLRRSDGESFWSHVDQAGGPDSCWPWTRSKNRLGYGEVSWDGKVRKAHRVAFLLANGHWSNDDTLHTCDNRACCNPKHLFNGTHDDNMADMKAKGRRKGINTGEQNGRSKLTIEDVREIRVLLASGMSQWEIAFQYGVGQTQISRIELGKAWRDV